MIVYETVQHDPPILSKIGETTIAWFLTTTVQHVEEPAEDEE